MLWSLLRVLLITAVLAISLAIALFAGLMLAHLGALGTCQDGTCELVAAIYVMPAGGVALYLATLVVYSLYTRRHARTKG